MDAGREEVIEPVLIGSAARIRAVACEAGRDLRGCPIVDVASEAEAAAAAVAMVAEGTTRAS